VKKTLQRVSEGNKNSKGLPAMAVMHYGPDVRYTLSGRIRLYAGSGFLMQVLGLTVVV